MTVQIHEVKVYQSRTGRLHKAVCTCGWVAFGDRDRVQAAASTHDMEWQAIDAANDEPVRP